VLHSSHRVALTSNIEVHVRFPFSRADNHRVESNLAQLRAVGRDDEG
jgi:hypothetical protein